ncbi:Uncharacterised protein [uncultured archaeon]|nr:Uncharacterised protein [uncultured archaeon]
MDNFDFDWIYKFNSLLNERFGPSDKKRILSLPVKDFFYFVRRADELYLSSRLCVDSITAVSGSLVDVAREKDRIVCYGLTGDAKDFDRMEISPEGLFYVIDPNPLFSYVALFGNSPDKKCILLYPHGSSLMSDRHKVRVLNDLLVESRDACAFATFEHFEQEWEKYSNFDEVALDRIVSSVYRSLARDYPDLEMEVLVDSESYDDEGDVHPTDLFVANIAMYHSASVDQDLLASKVESALKRSFPFDTLVLDSAYNRHLTELSVLFLIPDTVNAAEQ